jgi:hypothetical protein
MLIAEAQQRMARAATAGNEGAQRLITYFVGQAVGAMGAVKPARQVVYDMVEQYIEAAEAVAATLGE